ncbi:unnamed protein product, partial [Pylaiella littoralis]
ASAGPWRRGVDLLLASHRYPGWPMERQGLAVEIRVSFPLLGLGRLLLYTLVLVAAAPGLHRIPKPVATPRALRGLQRVVLLCCQPRPLRLLTLLPPCEKSWNNFFQRNLCKSK